MENLETEKQTCKADFLTSSCQNANQSGNNLEILQQIKQLANKTSLFSKIVSKIHERHSEWRKTLKVGTEGANK